MAGTTLDESTIPVIRGRFEGELTVRKQLVIYGAGKVSGKIRYAKVKVEEGAELSGEISMLDKSANAGVRNRFWRTKGTAGGDAYLP